MIDSSTAIYQIMTTPVISVIPNAPMAKVQEIFETHDLHHIPVVENKKVVGIISKSDYYKLLHHLTLFKTKLSNHINEDVMRSMLVEEVMVKQVATLHPEDKVTTAVGLFRENLFRAIPIVNNERHLVGIVTTYDIINYAFQEPFLIQ